MGSLQATEMAELMPMEQALEWHLRANHFPPVPSSMVKPCLKAIDAYWEDDLDREIEMHEGVYYRGETVAPARAIIIQHHLDAWCSEEDDSEEY
jgi:hypothetical protein